MSYKINHHQYRIFSSCSKPTKWIASRKPRSWAYGIGADKGSCARLPDEKIDRSFLKLMCADSSASEAACFLAIMAWGGMKYSHGRVAWQYKDDWIPIISKIRCGKLSRQEAFESFYNFRRNHPKSGFGVAYYTKLIFFSHPNHDGFIMDQWTARSVNSLFYWPNGKLIDISSEGWVTDKNSSSNYEEFCSVIEFLAEDLQLSPEEIEERMFSQGGRSPGQWRLHLKNIYN